MNRSSAKYQVRERDWKIIPLIGRRTQGVFGIEQVIWMVERDGGEDAKSPLDSITQL